MARAGSGEGAAFSVGGVYGSGEWRICALSESLSMSIQRTLMREASTGDALTHAGALQRDDGPTIAYDVVGDGPPVVFIHGLTSFRQTWNPITPLLAPDFTCVRMDLRGHGESSAGQEYSMQSLVGDVRAVVEEVGLGEPAVVGHSLGASIAAVYAAAHAARAVVCVDQSLRFGDFAALLSIWG